MDNNGNETAAQLRQRLQEAEQRELLQAAGNQAAGSDAPASTSTTEQSTTTTTTAPGAIPHTPRER